MVLLMVSAASFRPKIEIGNDLGPHGEPGAGNCGLGACHSAVARETIPKSNG